MFEITKDVTKYTRLTALLFQVCKCCDMREEIKIKPH